MITEAMKRNRTMKGFAEFVYEYNFERLTEDEKKILTDEMKHRDDEYKRMEDEQKAKEAQFKRLQTARGLICTYCSMPCLAVGMEDYMEDITCVNQDFREIELSDLKFVYKDVIE